MIRSMGSAVAQGSSKSYDFSTFEIDGFRVHDITVTGPINLSTRTPLYVETLKFSVPPHYFCIVDNTQGFENNFTYDDIMQLDRLLFDHGIRFFFGATITRDSGYNKMVKLAQENMGEIGMGGTVIEVPDRASAETFIFSKIDEVATARDR